MRTPVRKALCLAALAAICGVILAACGGGSHAAPRSVAAARTFVDLVPALPASLDETATPSAAAAALLPSWSSELVRPTPGTPGPDAVLPDSGRVMPYLALAWQRPSNGDYTFTLRRDARGATGDPLTATDVAWSLQRAIARSPVAPFLFTLANIDVADPVTVLDRHRVRINVTAPSPFTLEVLSGVDAAIYDSRLYRAHASRSDPWGQAWGATHSATFAAYSVRSFTPGQEIELAANPGFWAHPYYTIIAIRGVASSNERVDLMLTGNASHTSDLNWSDYDGLVQSGPVAGVSASILQTGPNVDSWFLRQNGGGALSDPRVRRALDMAINRTQLIGSVYDGHGKPAVGAIPAIFGGAQPRVYDPAAARRLLVRAGYRRGLTIDVYSDSTVAGGAIGDELSLLRTQLAAVGVTLVPTIVGDSDQLFALEQAHAVQSAIGDISPLLAGAGFLLEQNDNAPLDPVSPAAQESYTNTTLFALLAELRDAPGMTAYTALSQRAAMLVGADLPTINLVATQVQNVTRSGIGGYTANATPVTYYEYLHPTRGSG